MNRLNFFSARYSLLREDGGDPVSTQDLIESIPYVHDHVPPVHGT